MTTPPTPADEIEALARELRRLVQDLRDDELGTWRPLAEAAEKVLATLEMDQFARETLN